MSNFLSLLNILTFVFLIFTVKLQKFTLVSYALSSADNPFETLCFDVNQNNLSQQDIFNVEDTVDQVNIFEKRDASASDHHTGLSSPNILDGLPNYIAYSEPLTTTPQQECSKYCEYILQEMVSNDLSASTSSFHRLFEASNDVFEGLRSRWTHNIRPISKELFNTVSSTIKTSELWMLPIFRNSYMGQKLNSLDFEKFFYFSLLTTLFLLYKLYSHSTTKEKVLVQTYDKELVENMLRRINWFCEQTLSTGRSHLPLDTTPANQAQAISHDIGAQLQALNSSLLQIDKQLQNLDQNSCLITQLLKHLDQDIGSVIRDLKEVVQPSNISRPHTNFFEHDDYRASNPHYSTSSYAQTTNYSIENDMRQWDYEKA